MCQRAGHSPESASSLRIRVARRGAALATARIGTSARAFVNVDTTRGSWAKVDDKPHGVRMRVARARARFGRSQPFLVHYSSGNSGRSLDRPIGTITTKHQWAIVCGHLIRMLTADEYRAAMGFPDDYHLPPAVSPAVHFLGNAVPPPMGRRLIEAAVRAEELAAA